MAGNPFDDLPLGLSLRRHMDNFQKGLQQIDDRLSKGEGDVKSADPREAVIAIVRAINEDLAELLKFVDAENSFYRIRSEDIKPGVMAILVNEPRLDKDLGKSFVTLEVRSGEQTLVASPFNLRSCDQLADALRRAILAGQAQEARGA